MDQTKLNRKIELVFGLLLLLSAGFLGVEGAKAVGDASQLASEAGAMSHSMWDKFLNGANSVGKFAWQNTPYYQLGQAFNGRR